jgi:hypothetical protein
VIYKRGHDLERCPQVAGIAIIKIANVAHCSEPRACVALFVLSEYLIGSVDTELPATIRRDSNHRRVRVREEQILGNCTCQ